MKKAWIVDGIIRDVCTTDPDLSYHPDIAKLYSEVVPDSAEIQDTFIDGILTKYVAPIYDVPVVVVPDVPVVVVPDVVVVPTKITKRQAYSQLTVLGKLDAVLPALQAIPDIMQSKLAIIEFQESTEFERTRPLVIMMGTALGIDLDQAFIDAAKNFP